MCVTCVSTAATSASAAPVLVAAVASAGLAAVHRRAAASSGPGLEGGAHPEGDGSPPGVGPGRVARDEPVDAGR